MALEILFWTLVAVPLLLLLLVVAAAFSGDYSLRRTIQIASLRPCPKCAKTIGLEALLAGKERFAQEMAEVRKQNPHIRFRILAEWEIHCPHCGAIFYFDPVDNKIEMESRRSRSQQPLSKSS